jgi:hypothetical protein
MNKLREVAAGLLLTAGAFGAGGATAGFAADLVRGNTMNMDIYAPLSDRVAQQSAVISTDEQRMKELGAEAAEARDDMPKSCERALKTYSRLGQLAGSTEDQVVSDLMLRDDTPCPGNVTEVRSIVRPWIRIEDETAELIDTLKADHATLKRLKAENADDNAFDGWLVGGVLFGAVGAAIGAVKPRWIRDY